MPPSTPATFASAAASNGSGDGGSGRNAGGGMDWGRPRMNGSQTFRRPSQLNTATTASTAGHQRDSSTAQTPSSAVYVPPHMTSGLGRGAASSEIRYTKEQMLEVFRMQNEGGLKESVSSLLTEGWAPGQSVPASTGGGGGWGRRDDNKENNPGPDVCWDESGSIKPLAFVALSEEEKEMFINSVNSTIKPPQPKEGTQTSGMNGRKPSISTGSGPLANRPGTRRRDTSDSYSGNPLASPTFVRGGDNPLASPPPSLLRRKTDAKDGLSGAERPRLDTGAAEVGNPFGSLRRTTTNPLSAGINGPLSPWAAEPPSAGGFGRMGSFGVLDHQPGTPADKKAGFGSLRGDSRFMKDMRDKGSSEEAFKSKDKPTPFAMNKVAEESVSDQRSSRSSQRGDTGAIGEDPVIRTGSAALGGDDRIGAAPHDLQQPFRERMQQREGGANEPMSPTDTNPYQSPDHERTANRRNREDDEDSFQSASQARLNALDVSDQGSRSSSTAPPRNTPGFGSFTGLASGWSGAPGSIGSHARSPINDPFFGSLADIGSPGAGGPFGASGMPGQGNFGSTRSKLGSLFPQSIQDQMRANEQRQDFFGGMGPSSAPPRETESPAARSSRNILDDFFGTQDRSKNLQPAQSPFAGGDGPFGQPPSQLNTPSFSTAVGSPALQAPSQQGPGSFFGPTPDNDKDHIPHAQQRTMVMPDRMRWIYRDPSGKTQGPFSGLEMHDWYKAGFFSPELQVKKLEDADYEPLAQLIRRIGNSREPFLVPQIGIAHGSVVNQSSAGSGAIQPPFAGSFPSFGTTLTADQQNALERRKQEEQYLMAQQKEFLQQKQQVMMKNPMQFPGSSFNAHPGQLHHHSSAHSLQSQPSFGSTGTPATGFPGAPGQAPQHGMPGGFFDMQRPQQPGLGPVGPMHPAMQQPRDDEMAANFDRMNLNRPGHSPFGSVGPGAQTGIGYDGSSPVNAMLQDRQRLQQEQQEAIQRGLIHPNDPSLGADRLQEFNRLQMGETVPAGVIGKPQLPQPQELEAVEASVEEAHYGEEEEDEEYGGDGTQEAAVRPAAVSMVSRDITEIQRSGPHADVPPPQSVWAPMEKPQKTALESPSLAVQSLPPPPAAGAQRASRFSGEDLTVETLSRPHSPSLETPSSSLAPWAKETSDAPRGPSLKEIQEAEARKAAHQEAIAAEQRRQMAEQERIAAATVPAPAPGLPSSANWGATGNSPVTPGGSAWAKPATGKATSSNKKTLAQIQKEEEARKNKAAAAAAATSTAAGSAASPNIVAGKRYAELAGKSGGPSAPAGSGAAAAAGGAWTTVGSSGKAKMPAGTPAAGSRTVSGPVPTVSAAAGVKKPAPPVRANTAQSASQLATEQLMNWARLTLGKGLNSGINADELVKSLMQFPPDVEIVSDTIYAASTTLDGRRLAEEFIRRRKLADKGIPAADVATAAGSGGGGGSSGGFSLSGGGAGGSHGGSGSGTGSNGGNGGGWSEVAKKSAAAPAAARDEPGAAFKVVSKKKGGKR